MIGIADGCFICLIGPIAFDLLGSSGAAQGIGCVLGLASIPMMAGPLLAGLMYDHLGSYDIAFYCGGIPPIVAALLLFLIPARNKQKQAGVSQTREFSANLQNFAEFFSVLRKFESIF